MLAMSAIAALALAYGLRHDVAYALSSGPPAELGDLTRLSRASLPALRNRWVRAEATLSPTVAVRYARPLEAGSYRVAQVSGQPNVWVQIRVPADMEGPHFVPPTSFMGRILPLAAGGVRLQGVERAMQLASGGRDVSDAWLLVDDEAPHGLRWSLGVVSLLIGFACFNVWGLVRLLRPVHDG
jgi:hypothetical protein